jgi:hypothetical protein
MHATLRLACLVAVALLTAPANVSAQERPLPLADVLSFLLTNESVPTGDFVKDAQAAAVTRDTISRLLLVELTTLPLGSSSAGFTYRVNPALGTIERASQSFGPFFTERSLTAGRGRASIGVNLQFAKYTRLNDVDLESGEFVATGNQFRDEAAPFDVETLSMEIQSRTLTVLGNVGVTNRLDVGVAVPVVWLSLEGSRVNTYRGAVLLQATASGEATGLGDMAIRAKYRLAGDGGTGLAIVGEARLPTGREEDLLGSGEASYNAVVVGSVEPGRFSAHVNAGATWGGLVNEVGYRGALSFSASPRVTLLAELLGRRIEDIGELTQERVPHPTIAGVDTIRLVSTGTTLTTSSMTAGARWNVVGTWLLNASVNFPLANNGLRSETTTLVGIEYAFGGR